MEVTQPDDGSCWEDKMQDLIDSRKVEEDDDPTWGEKLQSTKDAIDSKIDSLKDAFIENLIEKAEKKLEAIDFESLLEQHADLIEMIAAELSDSDCDDEQEDADDSDDADEDADKDDSSDA